MFCKGMQISLRENAKVMKGFLCSNCILEQHLYKLIKHLKNVVLIRTNWMLTQLNDREYKYN